MTNSVHQPKPAPFSWDELKTVPMSAFSSLQAYWLTDPLSGVIRSEHALVECGELIDFAGIKYHVLHVPFCVVDESNPAAVASLKAKKDEVLIARLRATSGPSDDRDLLPAPARLDGIVVRDFTFAEEMLVNAIFWQARFEGETCAIKTKFSGHCAFSYATFSGVAKFHYATFLGFAMFDFVTFQNKARFDSAVFMGRTIFRETVFGGRMSFQGAEFTNVAYFTQITWPLSFSDYNQSFDRCVFLSFADFHSSGFGHFSAFFGTKFSESVRLDDVPEPVARAALNHDLGGAKAFQGQSYEDSLKSIEVGCRNLKQQMVAVGDRSRERILYVFELQARRLQAATPKTEQLISDGYAFLSDYGNSVTKPVIGILILWFAFATAYMFFRVGVPIGENLMQAGELSLSRIMPFNTFGDITGKLADEINGTGRPVTAGIFAALTGIQSIIATVLGFLMALAVKRTFQIGG
ncbi:hypothetical protein AEAC466_14500 [Asticcacaulis sp. AC466]|uniref:pentapeptide repeat-containing protein n=1 Tax=Asticcacaulis sp. AC466 TaxID=1282362 RepID=UPI0003C3F0CF|nr:pentapeptide repeat-containing protein [Asticcacaulis sp. AC466]ESQ83070.1 hypothetical protein AEAC466_14500 [Asticcacaulis sp. AC466]